MCAAAFLVPFMGSSMTVALPRIGAEFGMKAVTLTWVVTSYLIVTAAFQIPFARVADIVGRKKIFLTGVSVFTVTTLLSGFSTSAAMLIALRAVSGIGAAMMFGTNIAIISSLFPPERRGRALGLNVAVVYAALAAGPFFGGFLVHYLGWHTIFFAGAGVGTLALLFALLFLRGEWVEARGERFDWQGSILYGMSLAGIIYGFSRLPSPGGFVFLAVGVAALVTFVRFEKRQAYPVLDVRLFSGNRVFALSSLAALINFASTAGIAFMLGLYLQYVRGLNPSEAGLIIVFQAVIQSGFSLLAGWLSDRMSAALLATLGMAMICLGLAGLLFFLTLTTPLGLLVGMLAFFGVGFGIFSSPNTNVIMGSVHPRNYSQASAATGTMRLAGQSFSMGIAGMAISFTIGYEKIVPDLHEHFMDAMRIAFAIFLALCLIGTYASSARVKVKKS